MKEFLPFIISGIATGAIYGLAGTGLVLTYKTSGIFNFGHGALATAGAYFFYFLHNDHGMNWIPALIISVFVLGPIMGLIMEKIARKLSKQPTSAKIVGTVGLILFVQGLAVVKYGADTIRVPYYLPKAFEHFRVGGVNILYPQLWVMLVALIAVIALYGLFRFSREGVAMRAVVDDSDLLAMQAVDPVRVRRISWIIGATFASLSGVLVLQFVGLNAVTLTFLVVQAFGAAAIGAFSSIPLTFVGGLLIGIASSISTKYVVSVDWLAGLPDSVPFIVLFLTLLLLPRRKLVPPATRTNRTDLQWRGPTNVRIAAGVFWLIPILLLPTFVGSKLTFFGTGFSQAILLLSLGLLVRTSGQVSLCHAAFAAIGACTFSQLVVQHEFPWLLGLLCAGLVVVPVGAIVAIPAIRLSGLFLALATFGFGILVERLFYGRGFMFTQLQDGRKMPRPSFAETDTQFYYVVIFFVVVTSVIISVIIKSRLGRVLRGLSEAPVAVGTLGLSTNVTRVIVFCISAFFAGVAGVLYGCTLNFASSESPAWTSFFSLVLLAVLALAPFAEPWYAVFIGATSVVPGYWDSGNALYWLNVIFGFFAVLVSMESGHPSMPVKWQKFFESLAWPKPKPLPVSPPIELTGAPVEQKTGLQAGGLKVAFGGLIALHELNLEAPIGRVTGLIGPNGAGKTTAFNAFSGLNRRFDGTVQFRGEDVSKLPPPARGRMGLGRTFQIMELGDSLTVWENVSLGAESKLAGNGVNTQLAASPAQAKAVAKATAEALELCHIADLAKLPAGTLSTGQRRLVELARCIAGDFELLLLDEPSSGLDRDETAAFEAVLRRVVQTRGCGILLVEHDMSLVMNVCEYIYVLDFGRLIFEGTPAEVAASPVVRSAYLGADSDELDQQAALVSGDAGSGLETKETS